MANKTLEVVRTNEPNSASAGFDMTTVAANDKILIDFDCKDQQTTFLVKCGTTAGNLTIKAGDSLQGVNDEVIALTAGKFHVFSIDSGRFKNISGTDKGKVVLNAGVALDIAVVETRV